MHINKRNIHVIMTALFSRSMRLAVEIKHVYSGLIITDTLFLFDFGRLMWYGYNIRNGTYEELDDCYQKVTNKKKTPRGTLKLQPYTKHVTTLVINHNI